jgi:hypothetical protein
VVSLLARARSSPWARAGLVALLLSPLLLLVRRPSSPGSLAVGAVASGVVPSASSAASVSAEPPGPPEPPEPEPADLAAPEEPAGGDRAAVSHEDFARGTLYLWASAEQTALLRRDRSLIEALRKSKLPRLGAALRGAKDPTSLQLQRALRDSERTLCGLAWSNPWGTAPGDDGKPEPRALVKIRLRPDAYVGSFDGSRKRPWRFVDLAGREVAAGKVMARPDRLAAVYYVIGGAKPARGYALSSEEAIASWSLDTDEIRSDLTSAAARVASWPPSAEEGWPRRVAEEIWPRDLTTPESTLASVDEAFQPGRWGELAKVLQPPSGKARPLIVKPAAGKPFSDLTARGVQRQVCTEHGSTTRCAPLPPPKRRAHDGRFCVDEDGHMRDCKPRR